MDQRTMVARSHGTYSLSLNSSLHPHYPSQQHQQQPQGQVQSVQSVQPVQQLQQPVVHQPQQPVPQQQRPPPINVQSPTRSFYQQSQDGADALSTMEESLKRTVRIVYWYKAGHEPIRLHQEIPTFPYVRLSQLAHLVSDLGLNPNSLVDAYDPECQTWGQQPIHAVQTVRTIPRLLYRARKSLLEGLADHECPGLDHELRLLHQHYVHGGHPQSSPTVAQGVVSPGNKSLKRPAPDGAPESANKHFRTSSQGYIHSNGGHNGTPTFASAMPAPAQPGPSNGSTPLPGAPVHPSPTSPGVQSPFMQRDDALHPTPDGDLAVGVAPSASSSGALASTNGHAQQQQQQQPHGMPTSPHSHPPLKRWPNDYAVCEISAGFRKMDELIRQTPSLTQRAAFERVFGCRYVKSTVCRHRGVWKRADNPLKESFERMGTSEGALWGEFVKKTDFRREGHHRPVKGQQDDDTTMADVSMDYAMGSTGMNSMNSLGLGMLAGDEQPPMASLGPPPG